MKLSEIKGVGAKTEGLFNKLGIYDTRDLLLFYPRTYDVYEEPVSVSEISEEKVYAIWGTVISFCQQKKAGRYDITTVLVADDAGNQVKMTWFNMSFLRSQLKRGYKFIFRGKVAFRGSLVFMEQPTIYAYEQYRETLNSLQPIYPLTSGLTNHMVMKAIRQCLEFEKTEEEYLPEWMVKEHKLISRSQAIPAMHFPKDLTQLQEARRRLVFDEFFLFTLSIRSMRTANLLENNHCKIEESKESQQVLAALGYTLTHAQEKVYQEILADMAGKRSMNRLVQGDVGSGKTVLAMLAMVNAWAAGYQAALMAPTEVLARQHYESFCEIFHELGLSVRVSLLTGALTPGKKRQIQGQIAAHEVDLVIGTHALITQGVEYANLGLVITDEQHRFGVRQRETLLKKGDHPHVLVMSATPIPRSLAIILYGDLDISIVDEKPANRLPIKNCVVDDSYHPKAYRFIQSQLQEGRQVYIICAMAQESETVEAQNVMEYALELQQHFPPDVTIRPLHGKMKNQEKNAIMDAFAKGDIKILVSTTVVEVGINVPNATVMMIENAERFGLAQLHQLRGRVGRGKEQSYCIFVSNSKNKQTKERLEILRSSNDGFYISEQDLKLRGPGDILGTRQSGEFQFVLGDIYGDAQVLKLSSDLAGMLMEKDPEFKSEEHVFLRKRLAEYMEQGMQRLNL